jgi:hypothetical protein
MFWMIVPRFFCKTETPKAGIFSLKQIFSPSDRFKHSTKYSTETASAFTNGEETTDSIISKMLSNLSCLVFDRSSVMNKIKYAF